MIAKQMTISPAQITGMILLIAAGIVFFVSPCLSAAMLLFYIVFCLGASLFPQTNFLGPVINRGIKGKNHVSLTFDDGPSEPTTRQVINLLDKYSIKATFFVSGVNAAGHPEIIKEIIAHGHTVGNHSFHHSPFLMLKSYRTIYREIYDTQEVLNKMGIKTIAFRPPVGIINPKLAPILEKLEMICVLFSCRAADYGNRRVNGISRKILKKVEDGDIILLHDITPLENKDRAILLTEIENILVGLAARGLKVVPLSDLIAKKIMLPESEINTK